MLKSVYGRFVCGDETLKGRLIMNLSLDLNLDLLNDTSAVYDRVDYRVALCWSSAYPDKKVLILAIGVNDIARTANHKSFIRWVDDKKSVVDTNLAF